MLSYPKVSVVILNWNGRRHLESYLPSVVRSTYPNFEIVIGDNASTDSSIEFIKSEYPDIVVISNAVNLGFAGGYNEVLKQVHSDYIVLLNSDVRVDSEWIQPIISMMESDKSIAAAQPKILSDTNPDYFEHAGGAGGFLDMLGYPLCRGRIFDTVEKDHGQYDQITEIFWASGAAFFIRKSMWAESGGLDADFFAHMEEIDLCWRLKNKGFKIMACPHSKVYHLGGGSLSSESPQKTFLNFRNNLVMIQKNASFSQAVLIIFVRFWLDFLALIKFLLEKKYEHAYSISKAHLFFFQNIFINARKARFISIKHFNSAGWLTKSIVWEYFVSQKKTFDRL